MGGNIRTCPYCSKRIKKRYSHHISYLCPKRYICKLCIGYTTWDSRIYLCYHISCYEKYINTDINILFGNDIGNLIYKYIKILD